MTLEEQIQKLTAERDAALSERDLNIEEHAVKRARLEAERDAAQADLKAIGECVGGDPLAVRGLVESMDAVIKERDAALKRVAEMRDVVRDFPLQDTLDALEMDLPASESDGMNEYERHVWKLCDFSRKVATVASKYSTSCGKGYVKAESLKCFKCDDGYTPLYCLNCAREGYRHDDEWRPVVEALKEILFVVRNTPSVAAYFAGRKAAESLAHAESLLKK